MVKEKLMTDDDLKKFKEDLNNKFSKIYSQEDYIVFKKRAEKFLDFFRELKPELTNLNKIGLKNHLENELKSRLFLGIATELILKSVYLKEGYLINIVDENKLKEFKKKNPNKKIEKHFKIFEVPQEFVDKNKTYGINTYLKSFQDFFKELGKNQYLTHIRKGLEIAKIWRNKEAHAGGGYHYENGQDITEICFSLEYIYKKFFNEHLKPILPRKQTFTWKKEITKQNQG